MSEKRYFKCDDCQGTFEMGDDEEAQAELDKNFPGFVPNDCVMVCDDCYKAYSGLFAEESSDNGSGSTNA